MTKLLAATTLLLGLLAGCTSDDDDPPDPVVAAIEVTTPATTLDPGQTVQLTATARDQDGEAMPGHLVSWASSDDAIATVSSAGLVTAIDAGAVVISASSDGEIGEASLTVRALAAEVASIEISPAQLVLAAGATAQLTAVVRDADGEVLAGRTVTWASSRAVVAAVGPDGAVTALRAGDTAITATCEGEVAELALIVEGAPAPVAWIELDSGAAIELAPGGTRQIGVVAYADGGHELGGRPVTWTSSTAAVASVSAGGLIEAHADGVAVITAAVEGQEAALTVTVRSVAEVTIDRIDAVIVVDELLQLTAEPRDATGEALDLPVTWASDHPEVATVDQDGAVVGVAEGGALISATSEGMSSTVLVFVSHWDEQPLLAIGDQPLPATMVEFTQTMFGSVHLFRFRASGGTLRTRGIDGLYQLSVIGLMTRDGVAATPYAYNSSGWFTGNGSGTGYTLQPASAGVAIPATFLPDFRLSLVWQPDLRSPPATLVFGPITAD